MLPQLTLSLHLGFDAANFHIDRPSRSGLGTANPLSSLRTQTNFVSRNKLICPVQSLAQKYPASRSTRNTFKSAPSRPDRGAFRDRHERGTGCGGRGGVGAQFVIAGRGPTRERSQARRTNDAGADGEVVWS